MVRTGCPKDLLQEPSDGLLVTFGDLFVLQLVILVLQPRFPVVLIHGPLGTVEDRERAAESGSPHSHAEEFQWSLAG